MDQTPIDKSADSKFPFDPTNKVVGIIDDLLNTKAALEDLMTAGFMADEVELLTDDDGARRIDISGERGEKMPETDPGPWPKQDTARLWWSRGTSA